MTAYRRNLSGGRACSRVLEWFRNTAWVKRLLRDVRFPQVAAMAAGELSPDRFVEQLGLPRDPEPLLQEILSRDEFKDTFAHSLFDQLHEYVITLVQNIISWLSKQLPKVDFGSLSSHFELLGLILSYLLLAVIVAIATVGIFFLVRRIIVPSLRKRALRERKAIAKKPDEPADPSRLKEQALALAAQGKYGEALIRLFRVVLVRLDEHGRLILHPAKTNREILQAMPQGEPGREILGEMTILFNEVRYGGFPCGKQQFERFLGLSEQVTRGLRA